MNTRTIWARGLISTDIGKVIEVGDFVATLRGVEHFDNSTVLTVSTHAAGFVPISGLGVNSVFLKGDIDVPRDVEVTVHD